MNRYIFVASMEYPSDRKTALDRLRFIIQEGSCAITDARLELEERNEYDIGKADVTITCGEEPCT